MTRRATFILAICAVSLTADPPRPVAEPVADIYTPVPTDLQRLGGMLASRMRANTEGYLEHVSLKEIAQSFDKEDTARENWTVGKSAGLLLEASANSFDYSDDPQLKEIMNGLAKLLISHQQTTGYIGTYPFAQRWTHEDLSSQSAILLGLTAYSRVTGNDDALTAARRLANPLVDHLSRGKGAVADGREVVRPLLELYRATNDGHYLSFCRRLAQSSLSELSVESDTYSFVAFLSGLTDLYQLTADEAFAKAAESGWKRIAAEHLAVTGIPLSSKDELLTGCLTQGWLRLNLDLLRMRGDARYADQAERTVYNQLLAAQDAGSGKIDSCVPANGKKAPTFKIDPCAAAVSLGISEVPEIIWGRHGAGVAVLTYQPGHATMRLRRRATLQLYTESTYPASGSVLLHIEPSHDIRFPLQLLVPSWTKSFTAEIGGNKMVGKPGQFLMLDREWKKGDSVKISIDLSVTTLTDNRHAGEMAVQRGPQILSLTREDSSLNNLAAAAFSPAKVSLQADAENDGTYYLSGSYQGKPQDLPLVPFADVDAPYRLWIKTTE